MIPFYQVKTESPFVQGTGACSLLRKATPVDVLAAQLGMTETELLKEARELVSAMGATPRGAR